MKAVALALLLVVLLAPGASAQSLQQPLPCGPLSIPAPPASPAPVAPGGRATVVVEVRVEGRLTVTVTASAQTSSAGWTVVESPAPTEITGGESTPFSFTLAASEEATGPAELSIAVTGSCESAAPVPCPGGACSAGNANANVLVPLQADEGFRLPGLDNLALRPEYIIAAIILVGLATAIPFAMRKKPVGISADCPEPLKMVKPGRGTSFPIELRNVAKDAAIAHFEVGAVPEGWSAFMPLPEVQLAARESRSLWLMVRSPATARDGDAVDVELRLKDARGSRVVKVRAEVRGVAEP